MTLILVCVGIIIAALLIYTIEWWQRRPNWKQMYLEEHALVRRMYEDMHRKGGFFMTSATAPQPEKSYMK